MHTVLQIPELRNAIIEFATEDNFFRRVDRRVAFRLALTCKQFLEPSLDRLWESVDHISQVVQRLPQEIWKIEARNRETTEVDQATSSSTRIQVSLQTLVGRGVPSLHQVYG